MHEVNKAVEFDRARETPRRQRAVELLLSMGYNWNDGAWVAGSNRQDEYCDTPLYAAVVAAAPVDLDAHGLRALDLCVRDLRRLIELSDDFALDEMQIQSLLTAIESMELRKVASTPAAPGIGLAPRPMDSAPADGTMVRLLVQFEDHATEDTEGPAWTIGACNDDNVGDDERVGWQFAGWCWDHDHFTEGKGTPVGWLPLIDTSPKGVTMHNDGSSEAQFIADAERLNCTVYGGSGHVDDTPKGGSNVVSEYIAARDAYEEAVKPSGGFGQPKRLCHSDPIILRYRNARTALNALQATSAEVGA